MLGEIMYVPDLISKVAANALVASALLTLVILVLRRLVIRAMHSGGDFISDHRRRVLSNVKNALSLVLAFGLLLIWAPELRTFALSLTAFVVAFIVATKELILCLSGGILRTSSNAFSVGDWVEVGGVRGQVIDQSLLSVTVQEVYSDGSSYEFTGRTVVIPNSNFLTAPARNENFFKRYVFHSFSVVFEGGLPPEKVEGAIRQALDTAMAPHIEVARRYNALIEKRAGLDIPGVDPVFRLTMSNEGRLKLATTAFLPTHEAIAIEQQAIRAAVAVIQSWQREQKEKEAAAKATASLLPI
ncbi:mechanosensitive ion channel family protein [Telmatospirillum sp. J64-1]|uniref:mechanosensitive ion channel family protein n=1 Tax=Telmatospirillum sp. J64-1 TaxID=2502183 RepID=UPI00163D77B1|nr:mechanosensitive ion channel family protein [Telmatospirillum sp. J64-1]